MAKRRVVVIGLGRFGSALAIELAAKGAEVIAVDKVMTAVDAIKDEVGYAAALDATDPDALRSVEAQTCSTAVVAIGEDFQSATLAVAALRELGVVKIIARTRDAREGRILAAVGASELIELEGEMGRRLARALAEG